MYRRLGQKCFGLNHFIWKNSYEFGSWDKNFFKFDFTNFFCASLPYDEFDYLTDELELPLDLSELSSESSGPSMITFIEDMNQ